MTGRIWDPYLTEHDRQAVEASRDRRVGFGQRPALLLIDLYRWVYGDRPEPLPGALKEWPGSCGLAGWNAIPHIQNLLAASRKAGIPVIYVTGMDTPGMLGWNEAIHDGVDRSAAKSTVPADHVRRRYDIVDEVGPIAGEVVLRKSAPSAFWGTPLIGQLTHLGVDSLIVSGESTSGCVRASVVDAASHRFKVTVVEECVFDRHETTHAINLFDMHQKYADVRPLQEVVDFLAQLGGNDASAASNREPALAR